MIFLPPNPLEGGQIKESMETNKVIWTGSVFDIVFFLKFVLIKNK